MTVVAVGMLLVVTGCGSTKGGTATPSTGAAGTSAAAAALWDPCTQISDQVLQKIGLDPASKEKDVAGVPEPGFKVCGWHDPAMPHVYNITVFSTLHTVEDFKRKSDNIEFTDVSIQGRGGLTYRSASYQKDEGCDLIFPATQGAIQVSAFNPGPEGRRTPPCDRAKAAADALVPLFPR
ncbi:DUF3558 domain-containing protein [Nocardia sp. NPDC052278]|uniref:DUF3558 domain-containing protein n=1 Tax=unclassified Nocardia TaxID=2637762 RepID=UPI0036CF74F5